MLEKIKGLWYILPDSIREKLEAPHRYNIRKEIDIVLDRFGDKKLSILDVGAGDCFAKEFFAGHKYTAMDITRGECIDIIGDVQNMPFDNNTFDLVLCSEVLEYILSTQKALNDIYRVLKERGVLLMSTPFMVGSDEDIYRFTPSDLKKILKDTGFKVQKIKPIGGRYRMFGWQISKISYKIRKPKSKLLWPLYYLVKIPIGLIFQIIIPFLLFYIDSLDRKKIETCGYVTIASKSR